MNTVAAAFIFVWLGMILAISFLEAPLKFRAPGITIPLGVGIGRLVFRALNACEVMLAVAIAIALTVGARSSSAVVLLVAAAVVLAGSITLRLLMDRRVVTGAVSESMPRSNLHFGYIGLEVIKVALLIALGITASI